MYGASCKSSILSAVKIDDSILFVGHKVHE